MRRRKANRGRPKKAKKSEKSPSPEQTSPSPPSSPAKSDSGDAMMEKAKAASRSGDESEDRGSIRPAPSGYVQEGPTKYNIGSTYLELAGADDDIHCDFRETDVCLEVECGANKALMYLSRLCQGSKGQCIEFQNNWLTPNEFQYISGRETAKDWKRSIRHRGRSLKLLISKGILAVHPSACRCESCRYLAETTPTKSNVLKGFSMASKVSPKSHDSSNHSSSDSSKHSVKSQSLDNNSKDSKRRNGKSVDASEDDDDDDDDEEEDEDEEEDDKKQTETLTVEKVKEAPEEGKPAEAHKSTLKLVISKQKGAVIKKSESSDSESDSSSSASTSSGSGSTDSDTEEDIPLSRTVAAKSKANTEAGPATSSAKSSPQGEAASPKGEASSPVKAEALEEGSKSPKEEKKDKLALPPAKTNGDALEEESPHPSPENLIDRFLKNEDSLDGSDATIEDVLSTKAEASPGEKRLSPTDDFKEYHEENVVEELMRIQQAAEAAVAGDRKTASPSADKEEDKVKVDAEKKTEDTKEDGKSEEAAEKNESEKTVAVKESKEGSVSPGKEDDGAAQPENLQKADSGDAAVLSDDGSGKAKSSQPAKPAEQRTYTESNVQKSRLTSIINNLLINKTRESQDTAEPKKTAAAQKRDTPPAPTPPSSAPSPSPSAASLPPPARSEVTPKSSKEAGSSSRKSGESRKRASSPSRRESASSSRQVPGSAMSYMEHYANDMMAKRARYNYEVDHGDQHLSAAHKDFIERTKALSGIYPTELLSHPYFYHAAMSYPDSYNMMLANSYAFAPRARTSDEKLAAMLSERMNRSQRPDLEAARLHHAFSGVPTTSTVKAETSSSSGKQSSSHSRKSATQSSASATATHTSSSQRARDSGSSSSTPSTPRPAHTNLKVTTPRELLYLGTPGLPEDIAPKMDVPPKAHTQKPDSNRAALMDIHPYPTSKASPSPSRPSHSSSSASSAASPLSAMAARAATPYATMQMWQNCFPVAVQPPSSALEMNRLSQCFPALNGFLVPNAAGSSASAKRSASDPSNAVDLTQTKRRRHDDKGRSSTSRMSETERRILNEVRMGAAGLGLTPPSASLLASMGGMEGLAALPSSLAERKSTPSPAHHTSSSHYTQARSSSSTASHVSHTAKSSTVTSKAWSEFEGGKSPSGECTCNRKHADNLKYWTVSDVVRFVKTLEGCESSADAFRQHNVDGRSLPLLTTDHLTKTLGMKMGPALVLTEAVARKARELSQVSPCDYCRRRSQHV